MRQMGRMGRAGQIIFVPRIKELQGDLGRGRQGKSGAPEPRLDSRRRFVVSLAARGQ